MWNATSTFDVMRARHPAPRLMEERSAEVYPPLGGRSNAHPRQSHTAEHPRAGLAGKLDLAHREGDEITTAIYGERIHV